MGKLINLGEISPLTEQDRELLAELKRDIEAESIKTFMVITRVSEKNQDLIKMFASEVGDLYEMIGQLERLKLHLVETRDDLL